MKYVIVIALTAITTFAICNAGTILGFITTMTGKGASSGANAAPNHGNAGQAVTFTSTPAVVVPAPTTSSQTAAIIAAQE